MAVQTIEVNLNQITLDELLKKVREGFEVVLLVDEKPVARMVPAEPFVGSRQPDLHPGAFIISDDFEKELPVRAPGAPRIPGLNAGSTWISDDFDDELPDEFWLGEDE